MNDKLLYLEIVTPSRIIFSGYVKSVTVPGELGSFQILYNHAPIISNLSIGELKVVNDKEEKEYYAANGGFVMVMKNRVTVISDSIQKAQEIDVNKAKDELIKTKNELEAKRKSGNVEELEKKIAQLKNQIKVSERIS
ncbi:MAG: ATP synthase F1 subunit epsilon [Ignavibacteria bacterium]|nr:ATP synthase F1 subunit epsilon [Ignavibacteria bacterium]MDH7527523.1 ATP synthase F1 subunit epsilon [Ignavibacteria bacterium]NPV12306.1 ATP synthase F1 subunit epsilon [Ignavibacteria bacterium]